MTKEELEEKREEELERWKNREPQLRMQFQQEFARELGIHQGRMSILEEQIKAEESDVRTEDTNK